MNFFPLSPQSPFPSGEGGVFWFSYARGFAPCIPEAEPGRHRSRGAILRQAGGLPRRCRITLPSLSPAGGAGGFGRRIFLPPRCPAGGAAVLLAGFASRITRFFPHPPDPRSQSALPLRGRGRFFGLFRRGLPPPAPLRLNPRGAGAGAAYHAPMGGLPRRCRITLPSLSPMGGPAVLVAG